VIRAQGNATTVDELEEGLAGTSVGTFEENGGLVGAVNVSGLSQRLDDAARRRAVQRLAEVVDDLDAALNGRRSAAA
jgi:DNA-binding IclR family transcriptional regulator